MYMVKYFIAFIWLTTVVFGLEKGNIPLENLSLNRNATVLSQKDRKLYKPSYFAFKWDAKDNKTLKWRPQGITGITLKNKEYLAVSWYGRKEAGFENRGVRVSFVNLTNKKSLKYRHVLLVDKKFQTFVGMHAGGLVCIDNKLHVPDTRNGKKIVHVFSINDIRKVSKKEKEKFFNYKYILQEESSYNVPIKPSFMSYDFHKNKVLLGSFHKCLSKHSDSLECVLDKRNRLSWYSIEKVNKKSKYSFPYFSEMQGAASCKDPYSKKDDLLFTTSSYGSRNKSHLHIVNISSKDSYRDGRGMTNYRVVEYPAGLEDMHITKNSDTLWLLTEFGPKEGRKNNRVVFAIKVKDLL